MIKNKFTNSLPIITDSVGNTSISFNFEESNLLYIYEHDIPFEFIDTYLNLDREKAIEDLENIIIHSINIYKQKGISGLYSAYATFHASFLLAELKSEKSLAIVLQMLKQNEDFLDYIFGDFITEAMWMAIVKIGVNQLDVLESFVMNEDALMFSRLSASDALVQIALHYPDKRDAVLQIFDRILKDISSASDYYERFNPSFNAFIVASIIDLGLVDYLPTIKEMDSNGLIDRTIVGTIEDIENDLTNKRSISVSKIKIMDIKEMYKHFFAIFGASAFDMIDKKLSHNLDLQHSAIRENKKINRNDPCPCGSGKKFKKCCAGNGIFD